MHSGVLERNPPNPASDDFSCIRVESVCARNIMTEARLIGSRHNGRCPGLGKMASGLKHAQSSPPDVVWQCNATVGICVCLDRKKPLLHRELEEQKHEITRQYALGRHQQSRNAIRTGMVAIMAMYEEIAECHKEMSRQIKPTDEQINATSEQVTRRGRMCNQLNSNRSRLAESLVRNGTAVVAVEVNTTLRPDDARDFVAVMRNFARYFPAYASRRTYGVAAHIKT